MKYLKTNKKKTACQLKSGFIINNDNLYQDETYRKKISKGWIAEGLRSGCVNACLGWGGIEKDGEGLDKCVVLK